MMALTCNHLASCCRYAKYNCTSNLLIKCEKYERDFVSQRKEVKRITFTQKYDIRVLSCQNLSFILKKENTYFKMRFFSQVTGSDTLLCMKNFGNWQFLTTDTNVMIKRVVVQLRISKPSGSSLDHNTGAPGSFLSPSTQMKIRPRMVPSTSSPIHIHTSCYNSILYSLCY
jgi:hypothetical protein